MSMPLTDGRLRLLRLRGEPLAAEERAELERLRRLVTGIANDLSFRARLPRAEQPWWVRLDTRWSRQIVDEADRIRGERA